MKEFDLKVKVKKSLIFWSSMSAAGVVAIPIMIVSLVNGIWLIAIPCMAICAFDFYGLPLGWIRFAMLMKQRNIYLAITEDGITNIRSLASALGKREKIMLKEVRELISKRYLRGYILSDDCTQLVIHEKAKPKQAQNRCPSCGAFFTTDSGNCAYCNSRIMKH